MHANSVAINVPDPDDPDMDPVYRTESNETTGNMDGAVAMIDHTFKVIAHTYQHTSRVPLSSNTY